MYLKSKKQIMNFSKRHFSLTFFTILLTTTSAYGSSISEYWVKLEKYNGNQKKCMSVAQKTFLEMGFKDMQIDSYRKITGGKKGVYGGGMQCGVDQIAFSTFGDGDGKSGAVLLNSIRTKFWQKFRR
jgi:hypothetical protein